MSEPTSTKAVLELIASMERARQENKTSFNTKDKIKSIVALEKEIYALCNKYILEHDLQRPDCASALLLNVARYLVADSKKGLVASSISMAAIIDVLSAYVAYFIRNEDEDYKL